jgi:hypothetical protein
MVPPNIALTETSIPDSTSLGKDVGTTGGETSTDATTEGGGATVFAGTEQQSSLAGPPLTTQDPNLKANPQEDPNLFQLSSSTEQKQPDETNDGTTQEGAAALGGEGTSPTDTDTDEDSGNTALDAGDTGTEDGGDSSGDDDDDSSDGGDSSDSSDSDSGDSSDSSDDSGDSGDSGDDGGGDGDGDGG